MAKLVKSVSMEFQRAPRNEKELISGQWRLASVEEVKNNLEEIKSKGVLEEWSIVRLLDGWVTGSGYNFEIQQAYKDNPDITEMLLLKTAASRPPDGAFNPGMYEGVELSAEGREAALLLTVDDKITEVVYFVLSLFPKDAERLA